MDETFFTYDGTGITLNVPTPEGLKTVALFGLVALAIAVVLAGIRFWQNKPAWMKDLRIHSNTGLNAGAWILLTVFGALYVCVFVVLVGGLIWALSHVPDIIDGALYANDPSEARWLLASLAALTAVTSAAVALPFTVLKTIDNRRQTVVAEQNHITERMHGALERLEGTLSDGSPNVVARVTGIVMLVTIAREDRLFAEQAERILLSFIDAYLGRRVFSKEGQVSDYWSLIVMKINAGTRFGDEWANKRQDLAAAIDAVEKIRAFPDYPQRKNPDRPEQ